MTNLGLASGRQQIALNISEKPFMGMVVATAQWFKWGLIYHTWRSDHSASGFVDLILLRGDRGLALELKIEHDRTSAARRLAQLAWLDGFNRIAGFDAYLLRPSDWLSGRILEILR